MKNKNLIDSFKHAFEGFKTCVYKERNIKIHLCVMFLVILFGIILEINKYEWITCLILFGLVIGAELFNTAIEIVVDMITLKTDINAKNAKDIAAGSVLVLAISSFIVGLIIFVPKIIVFVKEVLWKKKILISY